VRPINVGWWETLAHAIFGVTGSNPIPDLDEILQPVADLARPLPEWGYASGRVLWVTDALSRAAVAAQFQSVGVWNPPDSGYLAVVTHLQHNTGLTMQVVSGAVDVDPDDTASDVLQIARDTRWLTPASAFPLSTTASRFTSAGVRTFNRSAAAQITSNVKSWKIGAFNTSLRWVDVFTPFVLGPSGFVALESTIANQGITEAVFAGYSMPLHKGKRA